MSVFISKKTKAELNARNVKRCRFVLKTIVVKTTSISHFVGSLLANKIK